MRRWIFQANPKHYEIVEALTALDEIRWRVPQYTDEIRPGDEVVIWRSGSESGIVGVGMVVSNPFESMLPPAESGFVLNAEPEGNPETRVVMKVRSVDYVPKAVLQEQQALREHQIVRAPMGTVFRLEQPEWDEIKVLLSAQPPVFDGGANEQPAVPLPYAWKDRRKDTYPLPGGNDEYLVSLSNVLEHVALQRPTIDHLSDWLQEEFGSSQSNARHISLFLRRAGFVRESAGLLELSEVSRRYLDSQDGPLVIAQLHARIRFIGEMLEVLHSSPASTDSLLKIANDRYAMGWSTKAQIQRRRGWFQSAGVTAQDDEGRLVLTTSGREILERLDLYAPEAAPDTTPTNWSEPEVEGVPEAPTPVPIRDEHVASLVAELHRTSVDSANPDDFENIVRDVFEFLGFKAEQLGGSGKTDVVADADLGRDDSYRIIIDGKTTERGAIKDGQIDWDTIDDHRTQHQADYVVIAGPAFGGERLLNRAEKHGATLLTAGDLEDLVRQHSETPLSLDAYRSLFVAGGEANLEALTESVEEAERLTAVALAVLRGIENHGNEVGAMTARDLYLLLRSDTELEAEEREIGLALSSLASPLLGILTATDGAFRLTGPLRTSLMRMRLLTGVLER